MSQGTRLSEVMVGRQPIYDRKMKVRAYELLFREAGATQANVVDGNRATSQVLYNTFVEIGIDAIVGEHMAFVNLTPAFLFGEYPLPASSGSLVLEILEDIDPTPDLVDAVRDLRKRGYIIALDDFVYSPHLEPLVRLAHIIKIDITQMDNDGLAEHVERLRQPGRKLLAEKVETHAEYEYCRSLGFDLYQGYFFCKPNIVKGRQLPANRLAMLQLLNALQRDDIDSRELEGLISQDVTLSYRMLRLINSAAFGMKRQIDSIKAALLLLGLDTVRNWASLLALSNVDDKPLELVRTSAVRARMAERLGPEVDDSIGRGTYFTMGLFSTLDALMDRPMAAILEELPLSPTITAALLDDDGPGGTVLRMVRSYEQGQWTALEGESTELAPETLRGHYLEALGWADSLVAEVMGEMS